ncbi:precorrin-6A/cobalt-precorrin-6A reductase [Roseovarius arcticus]|uniref:precorrin-6A/cobalt-precorrin-6A reductase n=1 Tax=Roseovarius arcticus TaxID=2547404 RepID=UPI0011101C06|nr:precorrin-6A/cobalt-precorrin-6A reductase [Roseovarius arcticus]
MSLLLLAGTGEARELADAMAANGLPFTVWLPEGGRVAPDWPCDIHRSPLAECLAVSVPTAILDASHPFAVQISRVAADHCAQRGLPYCLLRRPEWRAQSGDLWVHVSSEAEAAQKIAPGSRVLVASGREGLADFAALNECYVYCRQIGGAPDAPFPLPNGEWLVQQPPFPVEEEIALFRRLRIDWLVLRNAGSRRADSKLTAARRAGVQVAMIGRPAPPDAPCVSTVEAALEWAQSL